MLTRIEHNAEIGAIEIVVCDDAWILANRPKEVQLSVTSASLNAGQSTTLSVQLYTPMLNNGNRNPLSENLSIKMRLGDVEQDINLVGGVFSDSLQFITTGTYTLSCLSHPSNPIEVVVS